MKKFAGIQIKKKLENNAIKVFSSKYPAKELASTYLTNSRVFCILARTEPKISAPIFKKSRVRRT